MDLISVLVPGAQSLVTAILTDSWSQTRKAVAKLWAHHQPADSSSAPAAALQQTVVELDLARQQSIAIAAASSEPDRAAKMELFWVGYLAGQLAARPELADAIRTLPTLLESKPNAITTPAVTVNNKDIGGTVRGNAVQADNVSGGIRFGR